MFAALQAASYNALPYILDMTDPTAPICSVRNAAGFWFFSGRLDYIGSKSLTPTIQWSPIPYTITAVCPAAIPAYTYKPASGMCEREVPCIASNMLNASGQCESPETYILTLTPETATIEPGQSYRFTATVTNQDGGTPSNPVPVSVQVEVDPTSGGHVHGETYATRPKGGVSPTTGSNEFQITFAATEVSGTHTITATCNLCSNSPKAATVDVKVDGLRTITAAPTLYAFIGGETDKPHHDNHYLTNNAFNQLVVLAINYHFLYPNDPILHLNDASLKWGGKFDIKGNWKGDHQGHKRGTVIDIRANSINEKTNTNPGSSIPERLFTEFEMLVNGTRKTLPSGEVYAKAKLHCSVGRDPAIDNCVGDDNRHYHVILLGFDQ